MAKSWRNRSGKSQFFPVLFFRCKYSGAAVIADGFSCIPVVSILPVGGSSLSFAKNKTSAG